MDASDLASVSTTSNSHHAQDVPLTERQASVIARIIATLAQHTERAARWLILLVVAALWVTVALWRPEPWRLAAATLLTVLVFAPMWWRTMFPRKESPHGG